MVQISAVPFGINLFRLGDLGGAIQRRLSPIRYAAPTMRPRFLDHFVAVRSLLLVAGFAFVGTGVLPLGQALVVAVPFGLLFLTVFWFLRSGRNWARILTIGYSLLSVSGLQHLSHATLTQQVLYISDALFSAAFVFWLLRPHVRAYFKESTSAA